VTAFPLRIAIEAVTSDARFVADNGAAGTDDAVKERGLAYVGAADDGDGSLVLFKFAVGTMDRGAIFILLVIFGNIPAFRQPSKDLGGLTYLEAYVPILIAFVIAILSISAMPPSSSPARWASACPPRVSATASSLPNSTARRANRTPSAISCGRSVIQPFIFRQK